ncbi:MAG: glycosyltransferase, partial [Flavobacteriaceae bacterium]
GHGNVNGIDLAYFDPALFTKEQIHEKRHILGIAEDDFVFLFVGRIVSEKGIEELVNAFSELHENILKVKLVLVGSFERELDPIPYYIEEEIKKNPGIILAGFKGDVRPFFALCNVFVLPSYREGFPNVVLQSGAMGKYSIVTDINGSNEIITEGLNGTIVPIKDSEALKAAMMACLNAKTENLKTNMNHRRIIQDKYEQRFVWSELLKEYQKLT